MAELSSPLQVTGLIETNCSSDPGIYSIFRFIGDDYGTPYIGFAIFYSAENDMYNNEYLEDVQLLWERGSITPEGSEFLEEHWKYDKHNRKYVNNKDETIKAHYPIDKKGNIIE